MSKDVDYLVLGSGLSALTFAALMAQRGHSVKVLEAHEHFGGYGHTFDVGDYRFNAQFHYVCGCGEGGIVKTLLKHLNLEKEVTFESLNSEGYDHVYCDDKRLDIPNGYDKLHKNMLAICSDAKPAIDQFIDILKHFNKVSENFPLHRKHSYQLLKVIPSTFKMFQLRNATLQEVFDQCHLPKILQTLVSGQLIDYMLPPNDLSFIIWAALFNGYNNGAYYPTQHFESMINNLVNVIQSHGGEVIPNTYVSEFIREGKAIKGVYTQTVEARTGVFQGEKTKHTGKQVICNFDPKHAAHMIGMQHFSKDLQKRLDYDYSYSSFVLYGAVQGIDLADYGFGDWNVWHCQSDHNKAFEDMYDHNDYSNPYFAMNCRSLHTDDKSNCKRDNSQIFQICTVANYEYWKLLKLRSHKAYNLKKKEVLDNILDVVEKNYVPKIREHLVFKMTGSPTSNERYVSAPEGGSYGVNLTPRNFEFSRKLTSDTSLDNFHFCSAASGVAGFSGTVTTGIQLYENLSKDYIS
jgi:all-trans-retinol 13,14-reductase